MKNTSELLDTAIQDLECRLGLKPGQNVGNASCGGNIKDYGGIGKKQHPKKKTKSGENKNNGKNKDNGGSSAEELANQPEICKLEFKVGAITKVWNHPNADKLYCKEIDVGEKITSKTNCERATSTFYVR